MGGASKHGGILMPVNKIGHHELPARIKSHFKEKELIRQALQYEGPQLIQEAMRRKQKTLPQIAMKSNLPVKYVSQIAERNVQISARAYVILYKNTWGQR